MKIITTTLLIVFCMGANAQKAKTSVKINRVDHSVLYLNGTTTIGTVILSQLPNPKLTLNPPQLIKDSTGYTTIFTFNNPKHQVINDADINLGFNKTVFSVDFNCGQASYAQWGYNNDKTAYGFKAQEIKSSTIIQIIIKSQSPIITTISGLDFAFN